MCSSGGNAGLATAYSAMKLGMDCEIVVSRKTSNEICEAIKEYGANVIRHGTLWHEANEKSLEIVKAMNNCFYVHPFDHPQVWQGHSTMIDEIAEEIGPVAPSLIVAAVGGGGLVSGLVEGVRRAGWADVTKIVAMETTCTASFNAAVKAGGRAVNVENMNSIVTCLSAIRVCDRVVDCFNQNNPSILSRLVDVKDVAQACVKFGNHHRFLVGLPCGAGLAAVYKNIVSNILDDNEEVSDTIFDKGADSIGHRSNTGPVVVIVCGGNDISIEEIEKLRTMFNC